MNAAVGSVIISGGKVFDATGAAAIDDGEVEIVDGLISYVGPRRADRSAGARVIDATGATVMPGLIDGHTHVVTPARRQGLNEPAAAIWATNALHGSLRGGVTTVRDLGTQYEAIFALKDAVSSGLIVGPRLLVAGAAIAITGGHGRIFDLTVEADGPYDIARVTRQQLAKGADVIKLMVTAGVAGHGENPTSSQLTLAEMTSAVEVAHDAGVPVTGHAHGSAGIQKAILAGIDSIEHGSYYTEELVGLMLEHDVALSPTLSVTNRISRDKTGTALPHMVEKATEVRDRHEASFRMCLEAGVRITLGTDSAQRYHPLGDAVYELQLWVENGMANKAALEAATRIAAESCHIDEIVGTLVPGKRADILVVEGDPLTDIDALENLRYVLRDGVTLIDSSIDGDPGLVPAPVHGRGRPF